MSTEPEDGNARTPAELVAQTQTHLKAEAKALKDAATLLGPLAKPKTFEGLLKLDLVVDGIEKKAGQLAAGGVAARAVASALQRVRSWMTEQREVLQSRLGKDLKHACAAADLEFRVVSREDPIEVRIPPLAVTIDKKRGQAEVLFARQPLQTCRADAADIVSTHGKVLKRLETPFKPEQFFQRCLTAWRAARASLGSKATERVEILDFLPYLALEMQSARYRGDPIAKNFKDYPRAQFAYDVLRLRRAGGLSQDGMRLNLGVATGTTASQKKRVIYFEDENGAGEFKLTVFFTSQTESRS